MQEKQFENLINGLEAKAAFLDETKKAQLRHSIRTQSKIESVRLLEQWEKPLPPEIPAQVANLVKKLRRKKWSEEKIRNHIKKHFKITVI